MQSARESLVHEIRLEVELIYARLGAQLQTNMSGITSKLIAYNSF